MSYRPFVPGITVSGVTVRVFVETLRSFPVLREAILEVLGDTDVREDVWYSQESVLRAYMKADHLLGGRGLERFGRTIPGLASLPPTITSAHEALGSLDAVFHFYHARDGVQMVDPATGAFAEGIGHYHYERVGPREGRMVCDNAYPCRLDLGLCHGFAARFEPTTVSVHEPGECRDRGDAACAYQVRW